MEFQIQPGIYQHYKGAHYYVFGQAAMHDTTRQVVVYSSSKAHDEGRYLLRFLDDFVLPVEWPDGAWRPRFVREGYD